MAGHSKWAQVKHKKAVVDARKGKLFSKLSREISVASRLGGGNPDMNPRLRLAIEKAKEVNMPSDNIKRAIMKGTGELPGASYEEARYEGYGPGGVAIMIDVMTDNRNRTISEIRHIMSKHGGNIAEAGSVTWVFQKKGYILIDKEAIDEDGMMAIALEAGAEDFRNEPYEENYEIITSPDDLNKVRDYLQEQNVPINLAEVTFLPKSYVKVERHDAERVLTLIDALEEHDDVQNVYANFDIPDEVILKTNSKF
jgi:YebC/PmpR family DNA-binding regulatory protein